MNGHQNKAFSCLIGALNSPRKVNGYGADYAAKTGLNWTGDIVNLVELMYGLQEMQCLNDGKLSIEELGNRIFPLFGLQPRVYSRIYIDIKQRATKNGNRTYFLSRMRNMLEERIDQDIHISLRRK